MEVCKWCENKLVNFQAKDGVIRDERGRVYLDGPGASERLSEVCVGHTYRAGLTPAVQHPGTRAWVPGVVRRIGARNEDDHPFYADLHVPLGMSPAQAAKLQFPGCSIEMENKEDFEEITLEDLFPHTDLSKVIGTGLEALAEPSSSENKEMPNAEF